MGWDSHPDQPQPGTLDDNVVTEARQNPTLKAQHSSPGAGAASDRSHRADRALEEDGIGAHSSIIV
jgi:hypothetical protein